MVSKQLFRTPRKCVALDNPNDIAYLIVQIECCATIEKHLGYFKCVVVGRDDERCFAVLARSRPTKRDQQASPPVGKKVLESTLRDFWRRCLRREAVEAGRSRVSRLCAHRSPCAAEESHR